MKIRKTGQFYVESYYAVLSDGIGINLYKCRKCGRYIYVSKSSIFIIFREKQVKEMLENNVDVCGGYATSTDGEYMCSKCFSESMMETKPER